MRIVDLSSAIDGRAWEIDGVRHEVLTPAEGARHMAEGGWARAVALLDQ